MRIMKLDLFWKIYTKVHKEIWSGTVLFAVLSIKDTALFLSRLVPLERQGNIFVRVHPI